MTAKSKAAIELLQPHHVLAMTSRHQAQITQSTQGYLLALRLKPSFTKSTQPGMESMMAENNGQINQDNSALDNLSHDGGEDDELTKFINENFVLFEKLKGKKRNLITSAVNTVMRRAGQTPEVSQEIAEMVFEDLELQTSCEELILKCNLIKSLYIVIEVLCKRFGEVHLEQRQDGYAVVRVIFNEACRVKGLDDSFAD